MEIPLNFIFKESTPFQINNGDVLGNPSLGQRVVLEAFFKHIESKLIMGLKSISESGLSSLGSRVTPRGLLEFAVKPAASNPTPGRLILGEWSPFLQATQDTGIERARSIPLSRDKAYATTRHTPRV
jgi:hypothetical protein